MKKAPKPVNIYIHVPFCKEKCAYCCFYSEENAERELHQAYLDRLEAELADACLDVPLDSLYIGGGTPTLLHADDLERFFMILNNRLPLSAQTEISIECNPSSITPLKAAQVTAFANRISIGVQSFRQTLRDTLGRRVSDIEISTAIDLLGHENLNIDLIYAIPGQSVDDWHTDLCLAVAGGISHLSCYSLTLEEGTALAQDSNIVLDHDLSAEMWLAAAEELGRAGIERYEISNYALPGYECRHNLNIWHGQAYQGFGPAASSFDGVKRWTQPALISTWLNGAVPEVDFISPSARAREIFAMGLRTAKGWDRELWENCALPNPPEWKKMMKFADDNFICGRDNIRLKPEAMLFWDDIAAAII